MSLSQSNPRFLLDENVRIELFNWLKSQNQDVKLSPKSATDQELANQSKTENRIFVTNDKDFFRHNPDKIHAVVILRLPQNDPESLIKSFEKLLNSNENLAGKTVVLKPTSIKILPFGQDPDET